MKNSVDQLINNFDDNKKPVCQHCKEPIKDLAFIFVRGEIINLGKTANIFSCPEHIFNYAQGIYLHTNCWMDMLREHETPLYDMNEVAKKYNEKRKEKNGKDSVE